MARCARSAARGGRPYASLIQSGTEGSPPRQRDSIQFRQLQPVRHRSGGDSRFPVPVLGRRDENASPIYELVSTRRGSRIEEGGVSRFPVPVLGRGDQNASPIYELVSTRRGSRIEEIQRQTHVERPDSTERDVEHAWARRQEEEWTAMVGEEDVDELRAIREFCEKKKNVPFEQLDERLVLTRRDRLRSLHFYGRHETNIRLYGRSGRDLALMEELLEEVGFQGFYDSGFAMNADPGDYAFRYKNDIPATEWQLLWKDEKERLLLDAIRKQYPDEWERPVAFFSGGTVKAGYHADFAEQGEEEDDDD